MRRLADGSRAVAAVNFRADSAGIGFRWRTIGLPAGPARIRDLWRHEDLGTHTDPGANITTSYRVRVPPHGVALLRITPGR